MLQVVVFELFVVEIEGKFSFEVLLIEKVTVFFSAPLRKAFLTGAGIGAFVKGGDQFLLAAFFLKNLIAVFEMFDEVFHNSSPVNEFPLIRANAEVAAR